MCAGEGSASTPCASRCATVCQKRTMELVMHASRVHLVIELVAKLSLILKKLCELILLAFPLFAAECGVCAMETDCVASCQHIAKVI